MKTLLFAPMFIDSPERFQRHVKWLEYYIPLKHKLNYNEILFIDNASDPKWHKMLEDKFPGQFKIIRCEKFLDRISSHAYGYWHRAYARALKYAMENDYKKLVSPDTDFFILKNKVFDYINNTDEGWRTFWCNRWNFPESTFQIICKDQFQKAHQFYTEDFLEYYPYDMAETRIPFTHVEKGFNGDRWGEISIPQTPNMDFYAQATNGIKLVFNND